MDLYLKPKADRAARRRHPWIFSGAVARIEGRPNPGDLVRVLDAGGDFVAWGHYSTSQIAARLLSWTETAQIDEEWWFHRLKNAVARRQHLAERPDLNAYRLVFSESDFMPGLIVDWYDGLAVLQALTPGTDRIKDILARALMDLGANGVFERSDAEARRMEGLPPSVGSLAGAAPEAQMEIKEGGHRFLVDVVHGQKTGFFLDQRANRRVVAPWAAGREVLDCFAHTQAFSVYALAAGAKSVDRVESSGPAASLGQANLDLNGQTQCPGRTIIGDVGKVLREFRDRGRSFDLIILDPPRLAPTRAQVPKASRAYKDFNLLALKLLKPDGILATFSCSGGVDADLFQKIIFGASLDAGREAQIIGWLGQGSDHPVRLTFPEAAYLKGLLLRVP